MGAPMGFNPALRVEASPSKLHWLVLPELFSMGMEFHATSSAMRAGPSNQYEGAKSTAKIPKLKDRNPW